MTYQELSKHIDGNLYPDVLKAGGLREAFSDALIRLGSALKVSTVKDFIPYARVESNSRFSQTYIAAHRRLFVLDFWAGGIVFGNAACKDITDAANAIHFWIFETPTIALMEERFKIFQSTEEGKAHEAGRGIEYQWESLLQTWAETEKTLLDSSMSPKPLIEAAMKHFELRRLFPFTSMYRLRFRCDAESSMIDYPFAESAGNNIFRAYSPKHEVVDRYHNDFHYQSEVHEVIGEGTAEEVVRMLVAHLPRNREETISGKTEDFSKHSENQ